MILSGEELANGECICYNKAAMKTNNVAKLQGLMGVVVVILGMVPSLWISGLSAWAQLEAGLFDVGRRTNSTLPLQCPRFIAFGETGQARATLENLADKPHKFIVRTHISAGHVTLMYEDEQTVSVPAGEAVTLSWPISSYDAAYSGRMVFVRTFVVVPPPQPPASNVCGVYVIQAPFGWRGHPFMLGVSVLALVVMWVGAWLWWRAPEHALLRRGQPVAFAMVLLASLACLLAWWGRAFLAATALALIALIALAFFSSLFINRY